MQPAQILTHELTEKDRKFKKFSNSTPHNTSYRPYRNMAGRGKLVVSYFPDKGFIEGRRGLGGTLSVAGEILGDWEGEEITEKTMDF